MTLKLGPKDYFKPGDYNAICDHCGRKFKASELRKRWDNLMVCNDGFEERHPQDFLKSIPEKITPPFTRPQGADNFVTVGPADGSKL